MSAERHSGFAARRAATTSLGIAAFLFLFRPFGLSIETIPEALVVAGFAPLNFIAMIGVHRIRLPNRSLSTLAAAALIASANIAYLIFWNAGRAIFPTAANAILIAALTVGAALLWNRHRAMAAEILELKAAKHDSQSLVILKGENENEILRLPPKALRYAKAQGNYVEVRHEKADGAASALLRATLADLGSQAGEEVLIRCHRSYLVNLNAARRIVSDASGMRIEFHDGESIPVSRAHRSAIRKAATT